MDVPQTVRFGGAAATVTPAGPDTAGPTESLSDELRVLCSCLLTGGGMCHGAWKQCMAPVDWQSIVALSTNHHVIPLVYKALKEAVASRDGGTYALLPDSGVPTDVMTTLRDRYLTIAAHNVRSASTLGRVQRLLESRGIATAAIKGPALAVLAFGDISMRQFEDLDLLVRPCDVLAAVEVLEETGYRFPWLPAGASRARYAASLQDWSLGSGGGRSQLDLKSVLISHTLSTPTATEFMLDACRPLPLGDGPAVRAPSPEAMLLAVCVDGANDAWGKLSAIADVGALLSSYPEADWAGLLVDAARFGHRRSVLVGARVAALLLGCPLPEPLDRSVDQDKVADRLATAAVSRIVREPGSHVGAVRQSVFAFRTRERLRDRWRFGTRLLFVPSPIELNALATPAALRGVYWVMRPARLAWDALTLGNRRRHAGGWV